MLFCSVLSVCCFGWCKRQCGPLMALARTIRHRRISGWDSFLTDAVRTCVQPRKAHSLHCSSVLFTSWPGANRVQLCKQHGSSASINGQVYFSNYQRRFCRHVCWQQVAAFQCSWAGCSATCWLQCNICSSASHNLVIMSGFVLCLIAAVGAWCLVLTHTVTCHQQHA